MKFDFIIKIVKSDVRLHGVDEELALFAKV